MSRRAAWLLAWLTLGIAEGHEDETPKRDRLELRPGEARIVLDYCVPAGDDARALRERFDRDLSGALETGERALLDEYLAAQASRFVELRVDGRPVTLSRVRLEAAPAGSGSQPLRVRLTLAAAVRIARSVELSDRHKDRRINVPVVVSLADGLTLDASILPQPMVYAGHPLGITVRCDSCTKM